MNVVLLMELATKTPQIYSKMLIGTKQIETLYSISQMKMVKEIITVGDIEIEEQKLHYYKSQIFKKYVDIANTLNT